MTGEFYYNTTSHGFLVRYVTYAAVYFFYSRIKCREGFKRGPRDDRYRIPLIPPPLFTSTLRILPIVSFSSLSSLSA